MKYLIYNNNLRHHLTQFDDFKTISISKNDNPFLKMNNLKNCNELHLLAHGLNGVKIETLNI